MIYHDLDSLVGRTPILQADRFSAAAGLTAPILCKLECFNPTGSAKDRAAKYLIDDALTKGLIDRNSVIIEPTSGNTGVGLAAACASRGMRAILTMPDTMSKERRMLLAAFGAEIVLTPGSDGMAGAVAKAEELAQTIPGGYIPGQFTNPANAQAHFETTGPELWDDTDGQIDAFVAGVGTGGTLTGTGRYLKQRSPAIKIYAVEPDASPVLSEGKSGPHAIQGIGANFVPEVLDSSVYDEVLRVTDADAYAMTKQFARTEGLLVGISSGAALQAAVTLARRSAGQPLRIAVLLPDTGERYLSTGVFA